MCGIVGILSTTKKMSGFIFMMLLVSSSIVAKTLQALQQRAKVDSICEKGNGLVRNVI